MGFKHSRSLHRDPGEKTGARSRREPEPSPDERHSSAHTVRLHTNARKGEPPPPAHLFQNVGILPHFESDSGRVFFERTRRCRAPRRLEGPPARTHPSTPGEQELRPVNRHPPPRRPRPRRPPIAGRRAPRRRRRRRQLQRSSNVAWKRDESAEER